MNQPPNLPADIGFKDRRGGLIAFGILVIVLGVLCALFVPLMLAGQTMSAKMGHAPTDVRMLAPGLVVYAGLAVLFVWLGIGSILARRWARALLLILAWFWLLVGMLALGFILFLLPHLFAQASAGTAPLPVAAQRMIVIFTFGLLSVIYIILPGALVLFYRSPHVRATCAARDPVPRWTDACPLPVLGASLMLGFGAVSMLPSLLHGVIPFFGRLLSGAAGATVILLMMAVWIYGAWAMYRLKPAGWWVVVIAFGVVTLSSLITFSRMDLMELYRQMGFPQEQLEIIRKMELGRYMVIFMSVGLVPMYGYLLYVKKFFRRPAAAGGTPG